MSLDRILETVLPGLHMPSTAYKSLIFQKDHDLFSFTSTFLPSQLFVSQNLVCLNITERVSSTGIEENFLFQ